MDCSRTWRIARSITEIMSWRIRTWHFNPEVNVKKSTVMWTIECVQRHTRRVPRIYIQSLERKGECWWFHPVMVKLRLVLFLRVLIDTNWILVTDSWLLSWTIPSINTCYWPKLVDVTVVPLCLLMVIQLTQSCLLKNVVRFLLHTQVMRFAKEWSSVKNS